MERVGVAWEHGDYEALLELLNPEGAWVFVTDQARVISGPTKLVEALRKAQETTNYKVYSVDNQQLSDSLFLSISVIRTPVSGDAGGHDLGRHVFLNEVRDGLLYRREHFVTETEARAAFCDRLLHPPTPSEG
jgi:hypothetical protein